jgi:hypothetical protein
MDIEGRARIQETKCLEFQIPRMPGVEEEGKQHSISHLAEGMEEIIRC